MSAEAQFEAFAEQAEAALSRYFDDLLPRYLTAYLRGQGYTLITEMMRAHDDRQIVEQVAHIKPSEKARDLAARARSQCPAHIRAGGAEAGLLGLFTRQSSAISGEMFGSYREMSAVWEVSIFADAFAASVRPEAWPEEILLTVFHEYIHYFESFLLRSEQPLRSREEGSTGLVARRPMTIAEATRKDRRAIRRRWVFGGVVALALLLLGLLMWRPTFDSDARLGWLRAEIAEGEKVYERLRQLAEQRDVLAARAGPLNARLAALGRVDLAFSPARLGAVVKTVCPGAEATSVQGTLSLRGKGPLAELRKCVRALVHVAPSLSGLHLDWRRDRWGLLASTPARNAHNLEPEQRTTRRPPPTFTSEEGKRLRAQRDRLEREIQGLQVSTRDLVEIQKLASVVGGVGETFVEFASIADRWLAQAPTDVYGVLIDRRDDRLTVWLSGDGPALERWADSFGPVDRTLSVWGSWALVETRPASTSKHMFRFVRLRSATQRAGIELPR